MTFGTILFVCTGNTCRSPMAGALAAVIAQNEDYSGELKILTAGIAAFGQEPASPQAVEAMNELGLDISGHRSSLLTQEMVGEAELILCMTGNQKNFILRMFPNAADKVFLLKEYARDNGEEDVHVSFISRDILDPFGHTPEQYRLCAAELQEHVTKSIIKFTRTKNNF